VQIVVRPDGLVQCLYSEAIDLATVGELAISRASRVEPDQQGRWLADLAPVGGPVLGPFALRSEALAAEHEWLESHWLAKSACPAAG
jgi:hypothetical protein